MKRNKNFDQLAIDNLKINTLAAIEQSNLGEPAKIMTAAKIFHELFFYHYNFDVKNPLSPKRDRIIVSSNLLNPLYLATLRFMGLISDEEFRSYGTKNAKLDVILNKNLNLGIEVSGSSKGQNLAQAVGFALAENYLSNKFSELKNYTYLICNRSDLSEGIASEALAFAGEQQLKRLIILADSGSYFSDYQSLSTRRLKPAQYFDSLNLGYIFVKDGRPKSIYKAINKAKRFNKPVVIEIDSILGEKVLNFDLKKDGKLLNEEDLESLKESLLFKKTDNFAIYKEVAEIYQNRFAKLSDQFSHWTPSDELIKFLNNNLKENLNDLTIQKDSNLGEITEQILDNLAQKYENLFLGANNHHDFQNIKSLDGAYALNNKEGRSVLFGPRNECSASIISGISAYLNSKPVLISSLAYADKLIDSIELAIKNKVNILYIFKDDNLLNSTNIINNVGPATIAKLRTIDGLKLFRSADKNELKGAFEFYLNNNNGPVAICFDKNSNFELNNTSKNEIKFGAYYLKKENFDWVLISSGHDLKLALEVGKLLGLSVISASNRDNLRELKYTKNYAISFESVSSFSWNKYAKYCIGLDNIDELKSGKDIAEKTALDKKNLINKISKIITKSKQNKTK
ncbi:hypothetical protein FJO69_01580 [[Mycoplasma] falconis]|uniref:Transketolase N-terminal domain-containing protein n=1 Tax=[Mycoplasma] falconis TaxID=92403 RepID=A0A501XAV3_9BACT|nr:hypothetical protein [[Mycoplasma] falconis]TPE57424.1 hypothetical protein FJO69_01580 [[Mycoplasma] falconis]